MPDMSERISAELEQYLHFCFIEAREKRYAVISEMHLLLMLIEAADVRPALDACNVDVSKLRTDIEEYIQATSKPLVGEDEVDVEPDIGFRRVVQRAIMHVFNRSDTAKVMPIDVVIAIFGERDSQAIDFLTRRGATRLDVISFHLHGIKKGE